MAEQAISQKNKLPVIVKTLHCVVLQETFIWHLENMLVPWMFEKIHATRVDMAPQLATNWVTFT